MIDWLAFFAVAAASIIGASAVVSLYALGLRLLAISGRVPFVAPREFEDAITVMTPEQRLRETRRVAKARLRNPYSPTQKRLAFAGAICVFVLSGGVVLFGIYLIVPYFHG